MNQFLDGVYTVLVTPFTDDNKINFDDLSHLLDWQVQTNIVGVVLLGTTGETPTLKTEEKLELVKFVHAKISHMPNKKFILVGVGGNDTMATVDFTKQVEEYCDGIMVTVPFYNKPPQRGMVKHFESVANATSKPVMIYNVPSRTGVSILPETVIEVIKLCKNVVGIKDATGGGDYSRQLQDLLKQEKLQFKIFSGDDGVTVDICKNGGRGVISIASNITPEWFVDITKLCLQNNFEKAEEHMNQTKEFIDSLFMESNPIPIKELMFQLEIYSSTNMRLPLVPMDDERKKMYLKEVFTRFNQNCILNSKN